MENCMFFGISILIGFREGFGRGLGSQNRRFSHFFPCFFDVIFQARLERRKNRPRWANKTQKAQICSWAPVIPRLLGKGKDRGKNTSDRIARKNVKIGLLRFDRASWLLNLARCWHTFGGRRIESPPGWGHRRPFTPAEDLDPENRGKNSQLELQAGIAQLELEDRMQFQHFFCQEAQNL